MDTWIQLGIFLASEVLLGVAVISTLRADLKNLTGWVRGIDSKVEHHETRVSRIEGRLQLQPIPLPEDRHK